jgi:hypothetical protein
MANRKLIEIKREIDKLLSENNFRIVMIGCNIYIENPLTKQCIKLDNLPF